MPQGARLWLDRGGYVAIHLAQEASDCGVGGVRRVGPRLRARVSGNGRRQVPTWRALVDGAKSSRQTKLPSVDFGFLPLRATCRSFMPISAAGTDFLAWNRLGGAADGTLDTHERDLARACVLYRRRRWTHSCRTSAATSGWSRRPA